MLLMMLFNWLNQQLCRHWYVIARGDYVQCCAVIAGSQTGDLSISALVQGPDLKHFLPLCVKKG